MEYIGLARIFRGWVRPGLDPVFLVGGTMEGAEGPERGAKRREGEAVAPPRYGGLGHSPQKIFEI